MSTGTKGVKIMKSLTAEEKLNLFIEYLELDSDTLSACEKIFHERKQYDMAKEFQVERMTINTLLRMLKDDEHLTNMLNALKGENK